MIARSKGVKFGRSENTYPPAWEEQYGKWKADEISAVECFTALGIPKSSFYDMVKRYEQQIEESKS